MAENASLLVVENLPDTFDSIKPKLALYFQNKRRSGGEVLEIRDHPEDKRKAILLYKDAEAKKKVLAKGVHEVDFKQLGVVKLQVRPFEDAKNEVKPTAQLVRLENSVQLGEAAASRHTKTISEEAVTPAHKGDYSVLLSSNGPVDEEYLRLYFEQYSEDIEITKKEENRWILKCSNKNELEETLHVKEHTVDGSLVSVELYDEKAEEEKCDPRRFILTGFSEDTKLSFISVYIRSCSKGAEHSWEAFPKGSDWRNLPPPNLPSKTAFPVNPLLLNYVNRTKKYKDELETVLRGVDCKVHIHNEGEIQPHQAILEHTCDSDSLSLYRVASSWESDAKQIFHSFLDQFKVHQLTIENEVWEKIADECLELSNTDLKVSFEASTSMLVLVGEKDRVISVRDKVERCVKKAKEELLEIRNTIERKVIVKNREELNLLWNLVYDKLEDVESSSDDGALALYLKGHRDKVDKAEKVVKEAKSTLITQALNLPTCTAEFLKSLDLEEFKLGHFLQNGIRAAILNHKSLEIVAVQNDAKNAEDKIKELLKDEVISLTPDQAKATKNEEWNRFFSELKEEVDSSSNGRGISITQTDTKITLAGFSNVVADVTRKLKGYLENKRLVTEVIPLKEVHEEVLDVGGDEIRNDCETIIKDRQAIGAGEVILTCKGKLPVKILIVAVTPIWGKCNYTVRGNPMENMYLSSSVHRCLQTAEENQCASIVLPALGCGSFGFPVSESARVVMKAILEYCESKPSSLQNLKDIYVIEPDGRIIQQLNAAVKDMASKLGQTNATGKAAATLPALTATAAPPVPVASTVHATLPSFLLKATAVPTVNVSGVKVTLKKGDVTKETVDAIVNSTNNSLNLDSGRGGIKPKDSIVSVLKGFENYFSKSASTGLKSIFMVAFEQKVYDSFQDYFAERNLQSSGNTKATNQASAFGPQTVPSVLSFINQGQVHVQSMQSPSQVKIYNVTVTIKKGDITTETVKGIVNSTNTSLNLNSGAGGLNPNGVIESMLQGFKNHLSLQRASILKLIYIVVAQDKIFDEFTDRLKKWTLEAQDECPDSDDDCDSKSESEYEDLFPLVNNIEIKIGSIKVQAVCGDITKEKTDAIVNSTTTTLNLTSGAGNLSASQVATAMVDAVSSYVIDHVKPSLSVVRIVIFQQNMMLEFEKSLEKFKKVTPRAIPQAPVKTVSSRVQPIISNTSPTAKAVKYPVSTVEVYSTSKDGISKVKECIKDLIAEECSSSDIDSEHISHLLDAERQQMAQLCEKQQIQLEIGQRKITVSGKRDDVLTAALTINKLIQNAKERDGRKQEEKRMKKTVRWEMFIHGKPKALGSRINYELEVAYHKKEKTYVYSHNGESYTVDMGKMQQADQKGNVIKIKRMPLTDSETAPVKTVSSRVQAIISNTSPTAKAVKYPVSMVEVYSTSKDGISKVKECIKDLIAEECSSSDIDSEHISHLLDAERQQMAQLCEKQQIQLEIGQRKITVSGKRDDVLTAALTINKLIQNAKERDGRKQEEKRMKKTVRWEMFIHGKPKALGSRINYELEVAYHKKEKTYVYSHNGKSYTVDMGKMQQADQKGNVIKLKRMPLTDSETAIIEQPESWTNMKNKDFEIIVLAPNSEEFLKISREFVKSCNSSSNKNNVEVVQIERIQHLKQWQSYAVRKQTLDRKYPKATNERILYHGTTKDICQRINKTGFNRSFCGRNATRFGQGTYFAKEASYSCHNSYSNPDEKGHKYIYRARVITGKICQGIENLKEPTPVNPNDPNSDLCDCAVDSEKTPFVFVIFCDDGAYPEYLITFKILN
ncbi:UNVERIFIED_CONTAM: hypothetical protein FKN15_046596 [Acipenser sinensis]